MKKNILILLVAVMLISAASASGTGAGTPITAASNNIVLQFDNGAGGTETKYGNEDGNVTDWTGTVKAIHGLLAGELASVTIPGFSEGTPFYGGLPADADYVIEFPYTNRGNEDVTIDMTAVLVEEDMANHWSVSDSEPMPVVEDQQVSLYVTINSGTALAYERITMNCTASITEVASITPNVVSYNSYAGAVGYDNSNTNNMDTTYGGVDNIPNMYSLEAEGFALVVVTRDYTVDAPEGYSGGSMSDPVPGAKIRYHIEVRNDSSSEATAISIKDNIPNNCHLYFDDTPTVVGEDGDYQWNSTMFSPTANTTAGGETITFSDIYILPGDTVEVEYAVTID